MKVKVIYIVIPTFIVVCSSLIHGVVTLDTGNQDNALSVDTTHGPHVTHDNDIHNSDIHGNETDEHGNHSDHHDDGHHGVQLASLHFEYVKDPLIITIFLLIVALCKLGFHHANFLSSKIPESCLLIILGTIVGAILHFTGTNSKDFAEFSSDMFFLYLLPPIILESAYSLHDRVFFENLGTILLYAVIGTLMNCFIIAPVMYGLAICGAMGTISITLIQCFVFGSLIIAVDPVAVLAIFQEVGVNNVLYFLVFGESLLNDAVTVVIYNTMKSFSQMESIPVSQIFLGIGAFFTVSLGGLSIGILIGALCAFLTKFTRHVRVVEPLAVFSLAYASYLMAELFHFSGIISIIGCGLMQAQYAFPNISHKSHTTVVYFAKMLSATCDCIIFMFLGLSLVSDRHVWHTGFILWAVLLCLLVRFGVVYFLTFFANRFQRLRTIDWEEQFIMAYGGLRGAVAFSLVTLLDKKYIPLQPMFETATLTIIIFTVFVQGISIKPLVKWLRVTTADVKPVSIYEEINCHVTDHVLAGIEEICGHYGHNRVREKLDYFDYHYLRQWLMKDPKTKDDSIMVLYERMALQMHFENVAGNKMWTEFTSDYELYKPELINQDIDDIPANTDMAQLALDMQLRKRSSHLPGSPSYRRAIFSRGMTLTSPLSPMQHQNFQYPHNMSHDADYLPRKSTMLSDDVFMRSADRSGTGTPEDRRSKRESTASKSSHQGEDSTAPHKRRRSFAAALKRTFSEQVDDTKIEEPSLDDVRRWLVKNPTRQVFHRKYDRNLTQDDNNDLLHHLHEKQRRTQRRRISMGLYSPTLGRSPSTSPYGTPRGSRENLTGRPKTILNVISEGVPMSPDAVTSPTRRPRYVPYRQGLRRPAGKLEHSASADSPDGAHPAHPMSRARTIDASSKHDTPDGDTTPLLRNSPDGVHTPSGGLINPESVEEQQTPKFRLYSSDSNPSEQNNTNKEISEPTSPVIGQIHTDTAATPSIIIKSPSGSSIKNRGHLERQRTTQLDDNLQEVDESSI